MTITDRFVPISDEADVRITKHVKNKTVSEMMVLNEEHELKLFSGTRLLHSFVCSPLQLGELCAGWLYTEGYTSDGVEIAEDGHTAGATNVSLSPAEIRRYEPYPIVSISTAEMLGLIHEASEKYARSHGIHECVIKGDGWHVLRTDIGRHNAIDKAVGAAMMNGYGLDGAVMFSSGRINEQTVRKASRCRLGCLMSKAVATRSALELADKLGLKVLFLVDEQRYFSK